jgi:hypothetical protein
MIVSTLAESGALPTSALATRLGYAKVSDSSDPVIKQMVAEHTNRKNGDPPSRS